MQIEHALGDISFLKQLSETQLHELSEAGRTVRFESGQQVFAAGDDGEGLYVILGGAVRVYNLDEEGREIEYARLSAGNFFGELALLDGEPRSASVACLEDSTCFVLERAAFLNVLSQSRSLMGELLAGLSRRLRGSNEKYFWETLQNERLRTETELERHRSLSQMVAGVAHEINTPLGIVNTAASLLVETLDSELFKELGESDEDVEEELADALEAARLILSNVAKANRLVGSFKNLSVRQVAELRESVVLTELVEEIIGLFAINARQAGLTISIAAKLAPGEAVWLGYPGYLSQVLMNLLQNIERYAYPGGEGGPVEILIDRIAPESGAALFRIQVRDEGQGIAEDAVQKIFEPFYTTGRGKGGSGLGLAISRSIMKDALRGSIRVNSRPGEGCCFELRFPVEVAELD